MNKKTLFLFVLLITFLAACATVPTQDIKVDAQSDPKANISAYKTYSWLASAAIIHDSYGQWEPQSFDADAEIRGLFDRELQKRGMTVNNSAPDVLVAFAAGIDMDALGIKTDPKTGKDMLANIPQGGLVVTLIDSDTGFAIWVGVITADVQQNADAETVKARLSYAIKKLIKKLPK